MKYIVYSKKNCPNCDVAIRELDGAGVDYEVFKMDNPGVMVELLDRIKLTETPDFTPRSAPVLFKQDGESTSVYHTLAEFRNDILDI